MRKLKLKAYPVPDNILRILRLYECILCFNIPTYHPRKVGPINTSILLMGKLSFKAVRPLVDGPSK